MQGDVFGLNRIYDAQVSNKTEGLSLDIPGLAYGYWGGGGPTLISTIDRLDFSTETVWAPSPTTPKLSESKLIHSAVANNSYGYYGGGYKTAPTPTFVCTIDRLDFSNETITTPPAKLTLARSYTASISNNYYGYFGGGYIFATPNPTRSYSIIDRLDFSTESVSRSSTTISGSRGGFAGVENNSYGYFGGGYVTGTGNISTVDRLDFSTDTRTSIPSKLSTEKFSLTSVSSNLYGYFGGGYSSLVAISTIDRLDFSTETVWTPSPTTPKLSQSKRWLSGTSSDYYGYFGGGFNQPVPARVSTINRLDFITETITTPSSKLSTAKDDLTSLSINRPGVFKYSPRFTNWTESATTGYFGGGYNGPSPSSTIDRLDFATETRTVPYTKLSRVNMGLTATWTGSYGYFGGGGLTNSAPDYLSIIDRLDFSTESITNSPAKLTQARNALAAVFSNSYGYYASGGGWICLIDRLDFSNETVSVKNSLVFSLGRRWLRATSSENYGYFTGGYTPSAPTFPIGQNISNIDRLDFSSETYSLLTTTLSDPRTEFAAISNRFYGYFGGGYDDIKTDNHLSSIERIDFSNETISRSGNLPVATAGGLAAVRSSSYGYFGGGYNPPIPILPGVCTIHRLDFTTETVTTPSTQLSQNSRYHTGISGGTGTRRVGKATYGYFGGGAYTSLIDRLDYSTETIAPSSVIPKLSLSNGYLTATSSNYYGYFGGGYISPPSKSVSTIDRLDFSSETLTTPPAKLSVETWSPAACSNSSYGYFSGGASSGAGYPIGLDRSTINRLDFTTETTSVPTSKLLQRRVTHSSLSSTVYGYFAGGYYDPSYNDTCTIDRLDFSSEVVTNFNLTFSAIKSGDSTVSNNLYGYFIGGFNNGARSCTINRLDFSTETLSTPSPKLSQAKAYMAGASNSSYGYSAGGDFNPPPQTFTSIDRLDFASETFSVPSQKLTQAKSVLAAFSNSQ